MIEYDNGPGTRTRRHWVSATIGITAMGVFALLSLALLLGVLFGPGSVKSLADKAFPWSLVALGVAGVAMLVANARSGADGGAGALRRIEARGPGRRGRRALTRGRGGRGNYTWGRE